MTLITGSGIGLPPFGEKILKECLSVPHIPEYSILIIAQFFFKSGYGKFLRDNFPLPSKTTDLTYLFLIIFKSYVLFVPVGCCFPLIINLGSTPTSIKSGL